MSFTHRLLDVLVPSTCASCRLPGPPICAGCRAGLVRGVGIGCTRCGHPWPIAVRDCVHCPRHLACTRHAAAYGPVAGAVAGALKDHGRTRLADCIADVLVGAVAPVPAALPLVPVPLTPARSRERGFNQAELIARALARRWGNPVAALVERVGDGPPQRGASRSARRRQVQGSFVAASGASHPGAAVLVDDVMTTGATLAACALALRRAGVRRVGAVVFARVEHG